MIKKNPLTEDPHHVNSSIDSSGDAGPII